MDVHKNSWSISILTNEFGHKTFSQPPEVGVLVIPNAIFQAHHINRFMKLDTVVSGFMIACRSMEYSAW